MNPVFYILIILAVIVLWFLSSAIFVPLGKLVYRIWKDAVDEINKKGK